ncbi:MAG TPA: hypothetical protein ENK86_02495 [Campylobacterales bacterium]|nr:hypothetical protein [Campylobacterales bacterium]
MDIIKKIALKLIGKKTPWSIGIVSIAKAEALALDAVVPMQPAITASQVTDCHASFVADPFLIKKDETIYCFFEIKDKTKNKGVISVSYSEDGIHFTYKGIVLEEPFHLSYPSIYMVDGEYYMIPESSENGEVRLYKAKKFPYEWAYQKTLLSGKDWVDATVTHHEGRWYMFVSQSDNQSLYIYHSDRFDGAYQPHPLNPIYSDNRYDARPGGSILHHQNKLYRFGQDCHRRYGERLYLLEIETLSPTAYQEKRIKSILSGQSGFRWNARKMHHACYLDIGDNYLVAMDGEGYRL